MKPNRSEPWAAGPTPKIIGHRGLPTRAPENTLPSFAAALDAGVDALELDVRLTRDRRLVVIHDETVERVSDGAGRVADLTYAEMRRLDFGRWKGEAFAGTRIPMFEEALEFVFARATPALQLLVELKTPGPEAVAQTVAAIRRRDAAGRCLLLSFYGSALARARELAPDIPRQGFPEGEMLEPVPGGYAAIDKICLWHSTLTAADVARFHGLGLAVDVCPVDTAAHLDEALRHPVESLTTNAADVVVPLLRAAVPVA